MSTEIANETKQQVKLHPAIQQKVVGHTELQTNQDGTQYYKYSDSNKQFSGTFPTEPEHGKQYFFVAAKAGNSKYQGATLHQQLVKALKPYTDKQGKWAASCATFTLAEAEAFVAICQKLGWELVQLQSLKQQVLDNLDNLLVEMDNMIEEDSASHGD